MKDQAKRLAQEETIEKQQQSGYFGDFGGMFVPEILVPALEQLERAFYDAINDESFMPEFSRL